MFNENLLLILSLVVASLVFALLWKEQTTPKNKPKPEVIFYNTNF
tara:strand:- start:1045 stop:1179 length:135 start_codon:yes stop_codon:yes gene_type:complete